MGLVAGLLAGVPPAGAGPARAPLRLEREHGSPVSALELRLGASSWRSSAGGPATTRRLRTTTTYSLVGVTWRGTASGADPHLSVRSRTGGRWGTWRPLGLLTDGPDAGAEGVPGLHGTEPLWVGPADGVQVRARRGPRRVTLVLIDPGHTPGDRVAPTRAPVRATAPTAGEEPVPRPSLLGRRDWDADESWRTSAPRYNRRLKQVHVHHTVTGNDYAADDVPGLIRGMYRYHTKSLGWSDLGYNFLVDRFGRTWVGRAGGAGRKVRGAHTLGFNNTSTGVSVIGNFESGPAPRAVLAAIARVAAWKLDRNDGNPSGSVRVTSQGSDLYPAGARPRLPVIDGHRDTNQTACPGRFLYDQLPGIRRRTQRRMDRF